MHDNTSTFPDIYSPSPSSGGRVGVRGFGVGGFLPGASLFLAPMEDVTDIGFRRLCKRYGADMVYSEFVAAEALVRNVKATVRKLTVSDDERPVGIQIYGRSVADVVEAARIVEAEAHPDVIDLNFGCPVKKVAGKGAGAGMLQNIPLLLDITENVVKAVSTPVTVKTRLGWDASNYVFAASDADGNIDCSTLSQQFTPTGGWQGKDLADHLFDRGIKALTIHGRTRAQMYTGDADWTLIGEVAKRIHQRFGNNVLPPFSPDSIGGFVIGNGDIKSVAEAEEARRNYGVDAVMIGRATFGQPWLFAEGRAAATENNAATSGAAVQGDAFAASSSSIYPVTTADKIDVLLELLHINLDFIGDEYKAIVHTRRHLASTPIFKGIPDFKPTRIKMLRAEKIDELTQILNELKTSLK